MTPASASGRYGFILIICYNNCMCLAIPGKIIKIDNNIAMVDFGGIKKESALDLVPDAKIGDYILVHAGFAINKIDETEAIKTLKLIYELPEFKQIPKPGANKKDRPQYLPSR